MTQLGGSFRFVQLPAVTQLLAELGSTGRLCVTHAGWTGEIVVHEGKIVEARLGAEDGRAALEGIAVALSDGEFSFVDEPVSSSEALVTADERGAYLDRLGAEHQRLAGLIPSLKLIPGLVETPSGDAADTQVTIGAAALQLLPALVFGHPLEQVARQRGMARTLRDVAVLMEGGLVKLEPAVTPPAPVQPVSARPGAARPVALRAVATEESTPPVASHQVATRLSFARRFSPPAGVQPEQQLPHIRPLQRADAPTLALVRATPDTVSTQERAVIPPGLDARLASARQFVSPPAESAPSAPPQQPVPFAAWRKAIVGFFLHDDQPAADPPMQRAVSS